MNQLSTEDIASRIPHRYENLLLDKSTILSDTSSEFELHIPIDDRLGRTIFCYEEGDRACLPTPILSEIAALACIVSSGAIKPGTFAYFASINQFTLTNGAFDAHQPLRGTTQKISDKNGFHKYSFHITNEMAEAQGQLMAFYDTSGVDQKPELPAVKLDPTDLNAIQTTSYNIAPYSNKKEQMTFSSHLHQISESSAMYSYTYPTNHPLVRGHFPNNPVMMGVCQWQMLEDVFFDIAKRHGLSSGQWSANAVIFKADLTPVCDIKQAKLQLTNINSLNYVTTESVKKVMFKQRVYPGDQLFIKLTDIKSN